MNPTKESFINVAIAVCVASATGFFAMAALMVLGDWTMLQGLFAAAIIFFVLATILAVAFATPLGGPVTAGTAGVAPRAAPKAAVAPKPAPAPAPTPAPTPAPAPAPAAAAPAPAASSAGTRPEALAAARDGQADDLKKIKGVGPKLEKLCNSLGFYHFDQIANWSADEVAWVDENLEGFKGRVSRDEWVSQARLLAAGDETEFSRKVDKGDVY